MTEVAKMISFDMLREAVRQGAALRCRNRLQPDGGDGGKAFPPTYVGGVYAVEDRRIDGRVVRCVLLDSVQSQANRMEEVLQEAFLPNWRELPTDGADPQCALPLVAVQVGNHGWVTSMTAPHRIHDAILRDSKIEQPNKGKQGNAANETKPFRESDIGQAIVKARVWNATAFYRYCPTTLLFGTWDSTAGEGLDSAKIPRAVVSEIIGVDITPGVRTGSRLDPLGIEKINATFYRVGKSGWTFNESDADKEYLKEKKDKKKIWTDNLDEALKDEAGNPQEVRPIEWGKKPSDINHGNIPPDMARFESPDQKLRRLPDILESNPLKLHYKVESANGRLESHTAVEGETVRIRDGAVKPGGVTMAYALHTWTLSLTQLRRLRFPAKDASEMPEKDEKKQRSKQTERDEAGRMVLAALAIYALALQQKSGYWLRSRCELIPEVGLALEFVGESTTNGQVALGSADHVRESLLNPAITEAARHDLTWQNTVIRLKPSAQLLELVQRSDARRSNATEDQEMADAGATS